jgi:hypothetical protein
VASNNDPATKILKGKSLNVVINSINVDNQAFSGFDL